MKKELDEKLCRNFPVLYADRNASMTETCMCWGFDVDNGWFNIINALSETIHNIVENDKERAIGLYETTIIAGKKVIATQVKEKYGGLAFYFNTEHLSSEAQAEVEGAVSMAELLSCSTCEICGAPGELRGAGWLKTTCKEHAEGKPTMAELEAMEKENEQAKE